MKIKLKYQIQAIELNKRRSEFVKICYSIIYLLFKWIYLAIHQVHSVVKTPHTQQKKKLKTQSFIDFVLAIGSASR